MKVLLICIIGFMTMSSCSTVVEKKAVNQLDDNRKIMLDEDNINYKEQPRAISISLKKPAITKEEIKLQQKKQLRKKLLLIRRPLSSTKPHHKMSNYDKREEYIKQYAETAVEEMHLYNIPASIKLAQGIVESGAGEGKLAIKHNIHFCIKDPYNRPGSIRHHDDDPNDHFVPYESVWWSYRGHSKFLNTHGRYAFLFKLKRTDYVGWAKGLKKAKYATDPKYAEKLISVIRTHKLYEYDYI